MHLLGRLALPAEMTQLFKHSKPSAVPRRMRLGREGIVFASLQT